MRIFVTLLALFLCFAVCFAYPQKRDDRRIDEVSVRERRGIAEDLFGTLGKTAETVLNVPPEATGIMTQMISSTIKKIVDWLIRVPLQAPLNIVTSLFKVLTSSFPNVFQFLPKSIDSLTDYVRERARNLFDKAIRMLWIFLATRGLPWLRRILDQVSKLPQVPMPVVTAIKDFDALYTLAEQMGFIRPA